MIIIITRGENFVAHLDGLGGTPVAHHWPRQTSQKDLISDLLDSDVFLELNPNNTKILLLRQATIY
jgi:hypothetical protein